MSINGWLPERLQRYILPVPESGCWLWIGATDKGGYGRLHWQGCTTSAHRVVYRLLKGRIPARRVLDHLCRVRCCVNPDHVEPVKVVENNLRAGDALACWLRSRGIPVWFSYRHLYKPPFTPIFFWVLFAATFLLAFPAGAITGNVVSVLDGDTIEVLHNQYPERIRLSGIDCPEKGQAFGKRAKQATSELVFGKEVTLQTHGKDKYGRTIADVILPDGTNVNHKLVKDGWCWWYRKYAPENMVLEGLEKEAREGRKGLWVDPQPMPPWEWRAHHRDAAKGTLRN